MIYIVDRFLFHIKNKVRKGLLYCKRNGSPCCTRRASLYQRLCTLLWRHNGHGSVPNHQPHDCLLNRLFRPRSKKTSKLRVTGLCAGNHCEFPAQKTSNAENVSISWGLNECWDITQMQKWLMHPRNKFSTKRVMFEWSSNKGSYVSILNVDIQNA